MSSAILNPIKHIENTVKNIAAGDLKQAIIDPGDAFSIGESGEAELAAEADAAAAQQEADALAQVQSDNKAAAAAGKTKKKKGTQTVLTTPLGSTETAATAVTKLGGK